jgi:large subunit ribosomal protein L9
MKAADARRKDRKAAEAKSLASLVAGKTVVFQARAGEGDRLYGSITNADVADELSRMVGQSIERRFVELEHPIKSLGEHKVAVKLGAGAGAEVFVKVERAAEA